MNTQQNKYEVRKVYTVSDKEMTSFPLTENVNHFKEGLEHDSFHGYGLYEVCGQLITEFCPVPLSECESDEQYTLSVARCLDQAEDLCSKLNSIAKYEDACLLAQRELREFYNDDQSEALATLNQVITKEKGVTND